MKIIRGWSSDPSRPVDDPLLEKEWSFFIEFRGGDIYSPVPWSKGNWFTFPYHQKTYKWFCKWPIIPFISWRFKNKGGYLGAKVYGVDSPEYLKWMPSEYVYPGSQAICITIRPFATITKEKQ